VDQAIEGWTWSDDTELIAHQALRDVAAALGYSSYYAYNYACENNPDDVDARLEAL
jgi:hypothetical protein